MHILTYQKWDRLPKNRGQFYLDKMGKYKAHKKSKKSKRGRRERQSRSRRTRDRSTSTSSTTSTESEKNMFKKQLKVLRKEIDELRNKPSTSATAMCLSDEQAIPIFDSSKDDITVEMWVSKVNSLAEKYQWSDEYTLRIIASRVKGHARQWYYEQTNNDVSWGHMKIGMINHFRKSVPFANLLKDASNYETKPGQNLGDYCFKKLTKLRALKIKIPDEYLIDAVIGGIKDDNIARIIRSAQHQNADKLFAYLNTLGDMPT